MSLLSRDDDEKKRMKDEQAYKTILIAPFHSCCFHDTRRLVCLQEYILLYTYLRNSDADDGQVKIKSII